MVVVVVVVVVVVIVIVVVVVVIVVIVVQQQQQPLLGLNQKLQNITPPANSKASRSRRCVGTR